MKTWPLLLILLPLAALAQTGTDAGPSGGIYRVVDENGNVVFTDNPPQNSNAKPVEVGPTNTMDSPGQRDGANPRRSRNDRPPEPPEITGYQSLTIVSPDNEATVRMPQDNPVTIEVRAEPEMLRAHRLELTDNGTPVSGFTLDFPDPGTHTLRARIKDAAGQTLIRSDPVTLYVHRTSAATGNGQGGGQGSGLPSIGGAAKRGGAAAAGGAAKAGGAAQRGAGGARGGPAKRATY